MARKKRIEKIGFYHIVNRGVERRTIFCDDEDFKKFLEIVEDSATIYNFTLHSFCLMNNHYHLLLQTKDLNLSLLMRQINSRYSIYFNNKYKRVGPLWQGRFKSWFVYNESYLKTLVKYIEYNPIKAGITKQIGEYKWAMSSGNFECFSMLNYELIKSTNFDKELDGDEVKKIDELYRAKLEIEKEGIIKKEFKKLNFYFDGYQKDIAIAKAIKDGYTQKQIADFLNLSNVAISKIVKIYKQKVVLFDKLRDKGTFWSYDKEIHYDTFSQNIFIEYTLKYGDFDDMKLLLELFGKRVVRKVWDEKLKSDRSFIKTNLMIARIFFGMDVEADYFKGVKNARLEKLRLLAS